MWPWVNLAVDDLWWVPEDRRGEREGERGCGGGREGERGGVGGLRVGGWMGWWGGGRG